MTTHENAHAFTAFSLFRGAYVSMHSIDLQTNGCGDDEKDDESEGDG